MPSNLQNASQETNRSALLATIRNDGARKFHNRHHLIDTEDLSADEVDAIMATSEMAKRIVARNKTPLDLLSDKVAANVFYENSTRTRSSFTLAAQTLGAQVINLDINTSSVTKGETIFDTASTLIAMGADAIIQRHASSGAAHQLLNVVPSYVSIINAGDGWNAHPTQALLDLFTMREICANVAGRKVAIIGDIKHSRVARSNIRLLTAQGADVHVCAPPPLMPEGISEMGVTTHYELQPALENADFVISLRMQLERQQDGLITSLDDYRKIWRLDHARMRAAKPSVRLLHPGPINRGVELTSELADDSNISAINLQVTNGIPVRMAVLLLLLCAEDSMK